MIFLLGQIVINQLSYGAVGIGRHFVVCKGFPAKIVTFPGITYSMRRVRHQIVISSSSSSLCVLKIALDLNLNLIKTDIKSFL